MQIGDYKIHVKCQSHNINVSLAATTDVLPRLCRTREIFLGQRRLLSVYGALGFSRQLCLNKKKKRDSRKCLRLLLWIFHYSWWSGGILQIHVEGLTVTEQINHRRERTIWMVLLWMASTQRIGQWQAPYCFLFMARNQTNFTCQFWWFFRVCIWEIFPCFDLEIVHSLVSK